jgi:hypothetical protein
MNAYIDAGSQLAIRPCSTGIVAMAAYARLCGISIIASVKPAIKSTSSQRGLYLGSQPTIGTLSRRYCEVAAGAALTPITEYRLTRSQLTSVAKECFALATNLDILKHDVDECDAGKIVTQQRPVLLKKMKQTRTMYIAENRDGRWI